MVQGFKEENLLFLSCMVILMTARDRSLHPNIFNQCIETSSAIVFQISFFVATHFSLHPDLSALSIFHYYLLQHYQYPIYPVI